MLPADTGSVRQKVLQSTILSPGPASNKQNLKKKKKKKNEIQFLKRRGGAFVLKGRTGSAIPVLSQVAK